MFTLVLRYPSDGRKEEGTQETVQSDHIPETGSTVGTSSSRSGTWEVDHVKQGADGKAPSKVVSVYLKEAR